MSKAKAVQSLVATNGPPPHAVLSADEQAKRDALAGRLFAGMLQASEFLLAYLGLRLGFYESLARQGPATSTQLAARTKTDERYAREWLEAQAVAGILEITTSPTNAKSRRFALPAGHAEVLLNKDSLTYLGMLPAYIGAIGPLMPRLLKAYKSGSGIGWTEYGDEVRGAQGDQNRAFFRRLFAQEFLPQITAVHKRLKAAPGARVADIACGVGWSSIGMARAYPRIKVDGFDTDAGAIKLAKANAAQDGVADRVTFHAKDGLKVGGEKGYDLITICEALHDMSQPVQVLRAARASLAPGGSVLVMDENVLDTFTAPGPDLERLFYAFSTLACLPNGRADSPSAATGTVMRPSTLAKYAKQAGLRTFEALPLKHDFFRFYLLKP